MPFVAVIGAGSAGRAAASSSVESGARVVVFERSKSTPPPRDSWPSLLEPGQQALAYGVPKGAEVHFGEAVQKVQGTKNVSVRGRTLSFDSVVVATGTGVAEPPASGLRRGVHVLHDAGSYLSFGVALGGYGKVSVGGGGFGALEVADKVRGRGVPVILFSPETSASRLEGAVLERLLDAASAAGVECVSSSPARVAGVDSVEAVMAGGLVYPCDALVVFPDRRPNPPLEGAKTDRGGILVDPGMRTSVSGVLAAGSCSVLPVGSTSVPLEGGSTTRSSGDVAGSNASGKSVALRPSWSLSKKVFGIEVVAAGTNSALCKSAGLVARSFSHRLPDSEAATLVVEKTTTRVMGVQLAGRRVQRFADAVALIVTSDLRLEDVAFSEYPASTDISPVREAAREALRRW